jgi:uncharacterized phage protein (TIGR01671 family)
VVNLSWFTRSVGLEGMLFGGGCVKRGEFILMQFTGLRDKNGKEIYEGDVIEATSENYDDPIVFEVKPTEGGTYLFPEEMANEFIPLLEDADDQECQLKVIGNIYENPELLKEK